MTKQMQFSFAAALALTAGMHAQTGAAGVPAATPFQQAGQMGTPENAPRPAIAAQGGGGRGGSMQNPVVGKPVSATEERKTVQTLADGTQIENTDTNAYYRDSQGRTRVEQTVGGRPRITINDPVAHVMLILDPTAKTARKVTLINAASAGVRQVMPATAGGVAVARGGGGPGTATPVLSSGEGFAARPASLAPDASVVTEELGVQTVNGVAAQGTRNTQTIAAGKIGNNRDIRVVNERWYSSDLQMLIRTVNTDPRFGTTTYQLTNINQRDPDPALFGVPGDYMVTEPNR